MNIHVIGTGYVGLVTALSFCHYGHFVKCWDVNHSIIDNLRSGSVHFYEPGCDELLQSALNKNAITFKHVDDFDLEDHDELIFICVGTPTVDDLIDLKFVIQAVKMVGSKMSANVSPSIVIKSTVVPGTTSDIVFNSVKQSLPDKSIEINLGMAPEFLREGSAVDDCLSPDRIVIGTNSEVTEQRIRDAYAPFNAKLIVTSLSTAEFSKYANNAILALFVSMSNELARVAHTRSDINIDKALQIVGYDKRWSISNSLPSIFQYMYPGCGFGGSCFPKDVKALESYSSSLGQPAPILSSIISTNKSQPIECLNLISDWLSSSKKVGILGLSFKPYTDDIRESPSIPIVNFLSHTHDVLIHDPQVTHNAYKVQLLTPEKVQFSTCVETLISNIDVLILVTPWPQYQNIHELQSKFPNLLIYDCRSALDKSLFKQWVYRSYTKKELNYT